MRDPMAVPLRWAASAALVVAGLGCVAAAASVATSGRAGLGFLVTSWVAGAIGVVVIAAGLRTRRVRELERDIADALRYAAGAVALSTVTIAIVVLGSRPA